jgi:hypothetical protein
MNVVVTPGKVQYQIGFHSAISNRKKKRTWSLMVVAAPIAFANKSVKNYRPQIIIINLIILNRGGIP